jgi:hypothetical protein
LEWVRDRRRVPSTELMIHTHTHTHTHLTPNREITTIKI